MKLVSTLHSGSKFVGFSAVMNAGFQDVSMEADFWLKNESLSVLCKYIQCIHEEAIFRAIY